MFVMTKIIVYFVMIFEYMLIDMVEEIDADKKVLFRGVWESVLLHLAQQQDHKKIMSFLCKV